MESFSASDIPRLHLEAVRCDFSKTPKKAEGLWLQLIEMSGRVFGPRNPVTADSLFNIAKLYIFLGRNGCLYFICIIHRSIIIVYYR